MSIPSPYKTTAEYLSTAVAFLKFYQWIYVYPNTHILVYKIFDNMPPTWKTYFNNNRESINLLVDIELNEVNVPDSLKDFLSLARSLTPKESTATEVCQFNFPNNAGLSVKKRHEILSLTPLIQEITHNTECSVILDVGAGLGYLPRLLHEKYGFSVIGVESNVKYVERAEKIQQESLGSIGKVTYYHHYVSLDSKDFLKNLTKEQSFCITGLHACADLSVTVLELFLKIDNAKGLVIMPCCYHRLQINEENDSEEKFKSFPVSRTLKGIFKDFDGAKFFKTPFLRLACQGKVNKDAYQPLNCLFRAILQQVANEESCSVSRLKRKSGQSKTTESDIFERYLSNLKYTHTLIGNTAIDNEVFLSKMREKWTEHKSNLHLIEILNQLQGVIQPICENIVLLDRVEYLKENGVNCWVRKVTDDSISPRCYALVATKV